ncbi:MAG: MerR family transcriptional regulator [Lachnospiraceae bacterium]|nr:MerR family transcriptional regulator [Lachnospiraceae bacterium]
MYETLGLSRRVIQGYEQAGLLKPTGKNKYGHLLYDYEAFERVKEIRFLQQLGFQLKEIKGLIDAPNEVRKEAIKSRLGDLESEMERLGQLIQEAYEYMKELK